ncbi:MAG: hypothetical protein AAF391_07165 [Bacteroidota bacterium]
MNALNTYPFEGNYSFWLNVDGNVVKVTYRRKILSDFYVADSQTITNAVHFEFRGLATSPTGYKSHFTYTEAIDSQGGCPFEFATACAHSLYEEQKEIYPERFTKQLELF